MLGTISMQSGNRKDARMPGPQPRPIMISPPQWAVLERLLRQHALPQALALRVRNILRAADGAGVEPLAAALHCSPLTVQKWRKRWAAAEAPLAAAEGATAALDTAIATTLADAPRSGRPPVFSAEQVVHIVNLACPSPRSGGRPVDAWTPRELADEAERQGIVPSISPRSVGRLLGPGRALTPSEPLLAHRQDQSDCARGVCRPGRADVYDVRLCDAAGPVGRTDCEL